MTAVLALGAVGCDDDDNDNGGNDALLADAGDSGSLDGSTNADSTTDVDGSADAEPDGNFADADSTTDADTDGSVDAEPDGNFAEDASITDGSTTDADGSVDAEPDVNFTEDASITDGGSTCNNNGSCEQGEDAVNCPTDCTSEAFKLGGTCSCDEDCEDYGEDAKGICMNGLCVMVIDGGCEFEEIHLDSRCPDYAQCWGIEGDNAHSYCWLDCEIAGAGNCKGTCDSSDSCMPDEHTTELCQSSCAAICDNHNQPHSTITITANSCAAYYDCSLRESYGFENDECGDCADYWSLDNYYSSYYGVTFESAAECEAYFCVACEVEGSAVMQSFEELEECALEEDCDELEDCDACSAVIAACFVSGDGICSPTETLASCPEDCAKCGDGICTAEAGEDEESCRVDCHTVTNTTCARALDISAGGTFETSNFNTGDDYGKSGQDVFFGFTLTENKRVTLVTSQLDSPRVLRDTYLWLLEGDCDHLSLIDKNDDSNQENEGAYSRIETALPPGEYYVVAESYDEGATGEFKLTASFDPYTPICGDDVCLEESDDPESERYCAKDCVVCGDHVCSPSETIEQLDSSRYYCPEDCAVPGDGICTPEAESIYSSAADCGGRCGDFICSTDESVTDCPNDCTPSVNMTCETAIELTLGTAVIDGTTTSTETGLYDDWTVWYKFTVTDPGLYAIDIEATAGDENWLPFFDVVPSCDSTDSDSLMAGWSHKLVELDAGIYYIPVTAMMLGTMGAFSLKVSPHSYTVPVLSEASVVLTFDRQLGMKFTGMDAGHDLDRVEFSLFDERGAKLVIGYDEDGEPFDEGYLELSPNYDGDRYVATVFDDFSDFFEILNAKTANVAICDIDDSCSATMTVDVASSVIPEEVATGAACDGFFTVCSAGQSCDDDGDGHLVCQRIEPAPDLAGKAR